MLNRRSIFLLGIPTLIIGTGLAFMSRMYPIALNGGGFFGQDPAYQYLFAAVDILQGHAPAHTDHPGTPLQSLIALTILAVWAVSRLTGMTNLGVFESVLASPERYMAAVSVILLLLGAVAAYFLGRRVLQATGSRIAGVSCQLTALMFAIVSPYIVYPTPEAALLCVSVTLMGMLAPAMLGHQGSASVRDAIFAGVLCGLGVAVKVTFVPVVAMLLVLRSVRLIAIALVAMIVAWFVGVLPILSRLPAMFSWFRNVMTHSGLHGLGEKAAFDWAQYLQSADAVTRMYPLLYGVAVVVAVVLGIGVVRTVLTRKPGLASRGEAATGQAVDSRDFFTPAALLIALAGQTIMVAKHPGPTYMIPILPVAVLGATWCLFAQRLVPLSNFARQWLGAAWLTFLFWTALAASLAGYEGIRAIHAAGERSKDEMLATIARYDNPVVIGTFNCNLPECALWFGMLMVPEMELKMDRIAPDFYHFDIFGRRLHLPGVGELSPEGTADTVNRLVESGRTVLLVSPPYDQLSAFRLEKLSGDRIQNIYRVKGYERPN